MITIHAKESLLITKNPSVPYIEAIEDETNTPFEDFKIALASYVAENLSIFQLTLSKTSNMMAKAILRGKYQVGKGLRVHLMGMNKPLKLRDNVNIFGLGYKPTRKDHLKNIGKKEGTKDHLFGKLLSYI